MKTSNSESFREQAVQRPTSNFQRRSGVSALVLVIVIVLVLASRARARAEGSVDLKNASQPMAGRRPGSFDRSPAKSAFARTFR